MEEYTPESPEIHQMLHMRKAILGATKEKPRPHRGGKSLWSEASDTEAPRVRDLPSLTKRIDKHLEENFGTTSKPKKRHEAVYPRPEEVELDDKHKNRLLGYLAVESITYTVVWSSGEVLRSNPRSKRMQDYRCFDDVTTTVSGYRVYIYMCESIYPARFIMAKDQGKVVESTGGGGAGGGDGGGSDAGVGGVSGGDAGGRGAGGVAPEWCTCTRCQDMPKDAEKLCCQGQPNSCISRLPDRQEPGQDNKEYRHATYRQYILWQHGRLGARNRQVIPNCCVWRIRRQFPDPHGQYTDPPEAIVPEMVLSGDKHTRRDWLHSRAAEIVDLVFAEDIRIATESSHCSEMLEHMNNLLKSFLKRRKRLDRLGTLGQQEHGSGHARFGIKLWVLADSTNGCYISRFEDLLKMVRTLQATVDGLRRGNLGVRAILRDICSAQTAHLIPSAVQREKMLWMWSPGSSRGQVLLITWPTQLDIQPGERVSGHIAPEVAAGGPVLLTNLSLLSDSPWRCTVKAGRCHQLKTELLADQWDCGVLWKAHTQGTNRMGIHMTRIQQMCGVESSESGTAACDVIPSIAFRRQEEELPLAVQPANVKQVNKRYREAKKRRGGMSAPGNNVADHQRRTWLRSGREMVMISHFSADVPGCTLLYQQLTDILENKIRQSGLCVPDYQRTDMLAAMDAIPSDWRARHNARLMVTARVLDDHGLKNPVLRTYNEEVS
ncbi:hypothetical protein Bbelb_050580 [Branchiostoma belcheri]|nr:hypothetical protein Bbelb_050580 [Branchiostoma belcheri]